MGATGLQAALNRGAPLADVTVEFREGVDAVAATDRINATFEDFDLNTRPWYDQPRLRVGTATAEALERLFEWRLKRMRLERYDEATGTWGHWPDAYRWEETSSPDLSRSELGGLIQSIELSQPGADDSGQWWEPGLHG